MSTSQRDNNNTPKPPKVVIINTQYVETDSGSFKQVVQKLTGKDSKVVDDDASNGKAHKRPFSDKSRDHESSSSSALQSSDFWTRHISFKDFERLIREMPPMDEPMWVD